MNTTFPLNIHDIRFQLNICRAYSTYGECFNSMCIYYHPHREEQYTEEEEYDNGYPNYGEYNQQYNQQYNNDYDDSSYHQQNFYTQSNFYDSYPYQHFNENQDPSFYQQQQISFHQAPESKQILSSEVRPPFQQVDENISHLPKDRNLNQQKKKIVVVKRNNIQRRN